MSARVIDIRFSGHLSPTADSDSPFVSGIDEVIGGLGSVPVDRHDLAKIRPQCWPQSRGPDGRELDVYLFVLEPTRIAYVAGEIVQLANGRKWDPEGILSERAREALRRGRSPDTLSTTKCTECTDGDLGDPWECPCDSASVKPWNYTRPVRCNTCYSYAWRKRWCGPGGSKPQNRDQKTLEEVKSDVIKDGFAEVDESRLSPQGHFIALLVRRDSESDYHFLRLDGDRWTHKPSYLLASACDAAGNPIPINGVKEAAFPEHKWVAYFERLPGAKLTHCFP